MLDHAMNMIPGKGFSLQELKNLMIAAEGRPRIDTCKLSFWNAALGIRLTVMQSRRFGSILLVRAWTALLSTLSTPMS